MSENNPELQRREVDLELRVLELEESATAVLIAVWRAVQDGVISDRGPIADTALNLRDRLNPDWPANADWLPEELKEQ